MKNFKIIIAASGTIILLLIVFAVVFSQKKPFNQTTIQPSAVKITSGPSLSLTLTQPSQPSVGSTINVQLNLLPQDKSVQALDAILNYDKNFLKPLNITPLIDISGADYPQMEINEDQAKISLSLVLFEQPLASKTAVAEISFQALKPGKTNLDFDFLLGKTTDSNVVLLNDVNDSLFKVENLVLEIKQ